MKKVDYHINPEISPQSLSDLFRAAGMRRPIDDLPRLQNMLTNSSLTIGAFYSNELIGIARSMTDFCYCCYLSDLAVKPDFQRQGIGSRLIQLTRENTGPGCNLILVSAPGSMSYYSGQGFELVENGWIIKRTE